MYIDIVRELRDRREIIRANAREALACSLRYRSIPFFTALPESIFFLPAETSSKAIDPDPPFLSSANLQVSHRVNNILRDFYT